MEKEGKNLVTLMGNMENIIRSKLLKIFSKNGCNIKTTVLSLNSQPTNQRTMSKQPQPVFKYNGSVIRYLTISNWLMFNIEDLSNSCVKKWDHWLKLKKTQKVLEAYTECLKKDGLESFFIDENGDKYCNLMIATSYTTWANHEFLFDIYDFHELSIKHKIFIEQKEKTAKDFNNRINSNPVFLQFARSIDVRINNPDLYPPELFWDSVVYLLEGGSDYLRENVNLCLDHLLFNDLTDLTDESKSEDIRLNKLFLRLVQQKPNHLSINYNNLFNWLSPVCPELIKTAKHLVKLQ